MSEDEYWGVLVGVFWACAGVLGRIVVDNEANTELPGDGVHAARPNMCLRVSCWCLRTLSGQPTPQHHKTRPAQPNPHELPV